MTFTESEAQMAILRIKGEVIDCSICHKPLLYKYSHNAYPVNDGRCCETCNYNTVINARLKAYDGQD